MEGEWRLARAGLVQPRAPPVASRPPRRRPGRRLSPLGWQRFLTAGPKRRPSRPTAKWAPGTLGGTRLHLRPCHVAGVGGPPRYLQALRLLDNNHGCKEGAACAFCHLCPPSAFSRKKKASGGGPGQQTRRPGNMLCSMPT